MVTPGDDATWPRSTDDSRATGAIAWGLGLLALVCFPFVSSLAAGLTMFVLGRSQRSKGELARENGRRAANWGMTYALATVLLVGVPFFVGAVVLDPGVADEYGLGLPITVFWVLTVWHLVVSVWGAIASYKGRVFWGNGLPFVRAVD